LASPKPNISGTTHTLPFDKLSPGDFERLCLWLVKREGFKRVEHLGAACGEQGRDIIAWRGEEMWAFQCKRVRRFGPRDALAEAEKVLELPEAQWPTKLVFLVSCDVSAKTRQRVSERCAGKIECRFWSGTELDEKVNRHFDILGAFFQDQRPSRWERFRRHPLVFYPTIAFTLLAAIVGLLAGLISIGADLVGARQQLEDWHLLPTSTIAPTATVTPLPLAFRPAQEGEILILIATFHHSDGIADTEVHNEIRRAVEQAGADLGVSNLRVKVEPTRVTADDQTSARELGARYNASMVIWGSDTGVRVTVNFLNVEWPDFEVAEARIEETERTQIANPHAYGKFITTDLPGQLTFLSFFAIGQSYLREAKYTSSIVVIERAVRSLGNGPDEPEGLAEAFFYLGWLYHELGGLTNDELAIANYSQAIELAANPAEAYNNRGILQYERGEVESAISDYTQALAFGLNLWCRPCAYANRGIAYLEQGNTKDAIADFDQAIALQPNRAEFYVERGAARFAEDDLGGAIADYDKAVVWDPTLASAYVSRAMALFAQGCVDCAVLDCNSAIMVQPERGEGYNCRGLIHREQGDLDNAIADFDKAILLNPDDARSYYDRGLAFAKKEDWEAAIADYDKSIAREPRHAEVYHGRGMAYNYMGNFGRAIADLNHAIVLNPQNADTYNSRGTVHLNRGDLNSAIADFTHAILLNPNSALFHNNRGRAYRDRGDLERAIADHEQAMADYRQAIADYDQAITLAPDWFIPYASRGGTYRKLGNPDSALADFRQYLELLPNDTQFPPGIASRAEVLGWIDELEEELSRE